MKINKRHGLAAFTLIELMAVITIIIILAGLVVGGLGYVNEKQAREKARVQIALLSKGLEDYKLDMGDYPATLNNETGLGMGTRNIDVFAPGNSATTSLWKILFRDGMDNRESTFYIGELSNNSKQGWIRPIGSLDASNEPRDADIIDPWGNPYRYRTAKGPSGSPNSSTINPDFDLWSAGKDGVTAPGTPAVNQNKDDITNF